MKWADATSGNLDLLATAPLLAALVALSVIDLRSYRLPDRLTLPLLVAGLVLAAARTGGIPGPELIGAALGLALFWAFGAAYYRLRGIDGLGLGDAKLLAAGGAWLGWQALPLLVLLASVAGLVAALVTAARSGGARDRRLAFGPWLCAAIALLWLLRIANAP